MDEITTLMAYEVTRDLEEVLLLYPGELEVLGGPLVTVGSTVYIQSWGRDLGDAFGSSLSDALEIFVCP